ncbi:hypothetical protein [Staphylococcus simulans]|uniref:hypothetical protein n=1 Tax=Staphylococcus simulans TaxID=1286 RepID=UPI0021D0CCEA|nr:hypothetical protein [Staphylococcus simulans]UXV38781.1 hypothetical protein MUA87_12510 [Staphylococcus simulans]UXV41203.1 hypothetical protein MUA56_12730 [Staphylococcus simulans]
MWIHPKHILKKLNKCKIKDSSITTSKRIQSAHIDFLIKKVKVFLNNGEELTGYIMNEWRYEILLVKSDNLKDKQGRPIEKRMLIPKHSILYTANLIHLPELEE